MAFDPLTAAFDLGGKLLDKLLPDPEQKAQAMLQLEQRGNWPSTLRKQKAISYLWLAGVRLWAGCAGVPLRTNLSCNLSLYSC